MDLSKFKTSDWMKVGGGVLMLIAGFLAWISFDVPSGTPFSPAEPNAFDFFWTGTLPWILLVAVGLITFLMAAGMMKAGSLPWPLVMLGAAGLALLLILIRVLFNPGVETGSGGGFSVGRGIGMWLALIAGVVSLVGTLNGFKESGGNLADLTDVDKLKSSFSGGGRPSGRQGPPPPPPPGGFTPPPPPPGR